MSNITITCIQCGANKFFIDESILDNYYEKHTCQICGNIQTVNQFFEHYIEINNIETIKLPIKLEWKQSE